MAGSGHNDNSLDFDLEVGNDPVENGLVVYKSPKEFERSVVESKNSLAIRCAKQAEVTPVSKVSRTRFGHSESN